MLVRVKKNDTTMYWYTELGNNLKNEGFGGLHPRFFFHHLYTYGLVYM